LIQAYATGKDGHKEVALVLGDAPHGFIPLAASLVTTALGNKA